MFFWRGGEIYIKTNASYDVLDKLVKNLRNYNPSAFRFIEGLDKLFKTLREIVINVLKYSSSNTCIESMALHCMRFGMYIRKLRLAATSEGVQRDGGA